MGALLAVGNKVGRAEFVGCCVAVGENVGTLLDVGARVGSTEYAPRQKTKRSAAMRVCNIMIDG